MNHSVIHKPYEGKAKLLSVYVEWILDFLKVKSKHINAFTSISGIVLDFSDHDFD